MKHSSKNSKLICLIIFLGVGRNFSYSQENQTSTYWESIIDAENTFVNGYPDSSVLAYIKIVNNFGIPQLESWLNAYRISEIDLKGKYADTLVNLLQQKDYLFYLKRYLKSQNINYFHSLNLDTVKKRDHLAYFKSSRKKFQTWRKLERQDQRIRNLVSLKKLAVRDSLDRQKLGELYKLNDNELPTKIEMMTFQQLEPYWVIFQHTDFNLTVENRTFMDSILMSSLESGRLNPSNVKFHVGYTVVRSIPEEKTENDIYLNFNDFSYDWFSITHDYNSLEEIINRIGIKKLTYINQLRSSIYLEPITNEYLNKLKLFKEKNLYAR